MAKKKTSKKTTPRKTVNKKSAKSKVATKRKPKAAMKAKAKAKPKAASKKVSSKKAPKKSSAKSNKTPKSTTKMEAFLKPVLEVGSLVPDFKVKSSSGEDVTLSGLTGKKVVLYFYPKDDTPGCTLEGQEFNKNLKEFNDANTVVYGISRDSVQSHCKFIDKYGYQFELLSDPEEMLCQLFDVIKEKNMYGKKVMGIERSTFVIDEFGKLIGEFRKVSPPGHADQMLQFVRSR